MQTTTNDSFEGEDIGMRHFSSKSSDDKGRQLSWLCLGDVRPHFEKLKAEGGLDSPTLNHVITDDSDDLTSDDEDSAVETRVNECTNSSRLSSDKDVSHQTRKQDVEEDIDQQSPDKPSSDWSIEVLLAHHLVDYHRLSQKREINHVAIKMSEEVTSLATATFKYNSFSSTASVQPEEGTMPPFPSCKRRRIDEEVSNTHRVDCFPPERDKQQHQRRSVVTLHTRVSVIPIPARDEYSPRARESMWSSFTEMARNIARNSIEFASEGWNWRTAIEDDDMLVHDLSGELIHPIHLQNALAFIGANEDLFISNPITSNGDTAVSHVPLVSPSNID